MFKYLIFGFTIYYEVYVEYQKLLGNQRSRRPRLHKIHKLHNHSIHRLGCYRLDHRVSQSDSDMCPCHTHIGPTCPCGRL